MRLIDLLIKRCEEEAVELASVGMDEEAQEARRLASKYLEMKYNGHLTVYDRINKNGRNTGN
jgi:hypothetical protein